MLIHIGWLSAASGWVAPSFPKGVMPLIMGVLDAVVTYAGRTPQAEMLV